MKWPSALAAEVADSLVHALGSAAERLEVAGSLRRRKPMVGDVELVYIPLTTYRAEAQGDLFTDKLLEVNLFDEALDSLIECEVLARRPTQNGTVWGAKNKLAVHVPTGLPVDLFATTPESWANYLVCRTGPAASNIRIARAARKMGMEWHPYDRGFLRNGEWITCTTEAQVFETVGLPHHPPHERQ